jgi:hypothetical protein
MSFIEFLEAIARAAEYLSLPPPSSEVKDAYKREDTKKNQEIDEVKEEEDDQEIDMTLEERLKQPLNKKIENILPYLLKYCTSRSFKKKWVWPVKNPKYGLYEDIKPNQKTLELKGLMGRGINKLILSKMNIKELIKKKHPELQ